jgi:hypothetical protein
VESLDLKSEDKLEVIKPKSKPFEEIRIEPPIPVEPVLKSNVVKQEKAVKVDNGNSISKDAIKREDEELEKRPEIELLEKLKSHENEEKKILAESKQILEELKDARQVQFEKNKRKSRKHLEDLNAINNKDGDKKNVASLDEKNNKTEGVVKDKLPPFPLVLKEANKSNKTKMELNRDKRDLTSTVVDDEKEENCKKNEKVVNKNIVGVENKKNKENYVEDVIVKH